MLSFGSHAQSRRIGCPGVGFATSVAQDLGGPAWSRAAEHKAGSKLVPAWLFSSATLFGTAHFRDLLGSQGAGQVVPKLLVFVYRELVSWRTATD